MAERNSTLNPQQLRFVDEYLIDYDATKAAKRALYSEKTAHVQGPRLLKHVGVRQLIAEKTQQKMNTTNLSAAVTLEQLKHMLTLDPGRIEDENGDILPLRKMPPEVRACISSIKRKEVMSHGRIVGYRTEVRFWSKTAALLAAMQHFDLIQAAGLTLQLQTEEQRTKAEKTLGALRAIIERQKRMWHGGGNVVPIKKTNGAA